MIAGLKELVAPLDEAEFLRLLKERKLKVVRRPGDRRFSDIVGWARMRAIIEADRLEPKHLRVMLKEKLVEPVFYRHDRKVDPAMLAGLLERGASVITNALQLYVPEIRVLSRSLRAQQGECVTVFAIVTTGTGGAFALHYDYDDVLVVQVEGSKRWRIYDQPVRNPVPQMRIPDPPQGPPLLETVLEQGDLLVLPSGYWHHCENGPGLSHHLSILFNAPTGRDAFLPLLRQLADDELFRVRLTRLNEAEWHAHADALRARLTEMIRSVPLEPAAVLDITDRLQPAMPKGGD